MPEDTLRVPPQVAQFIVELEENLPEGSIGTIMNVDVDGIVDYSVSALGSNADITAILLILASPKDKTAFEVSFADEGLWEPAYADVIVRGVIVGMRCSVVQVVGKFHNVEALLRNAEQIAK